MTAAPAGAPDGQNPNGDNPHRHRPNGDNPHGHHPRGQGPNSQPGTGGTGHLCAVVLAAGAGTRLAPLTDLRPKALCPVGHATLLDRTLDRLAGLGFTGPDRVAVNAHHHADQIAAAVAGRARLSVERPEALGTAGAVAALRTWIAGRAVLVANADAYLAGGDLAILLAGWSGERPRLLVVHDPDRADFGTWRFAGMSLLPAADAARLEPTPTGLYEVVWRDARARSALELTPYDGCFIDCGTPSDYLAANLHASGGASVIGAGAVVEGRLTRSVVWPGGRVAGGEHLVESIRAGATLTVPAPQPPRPPVSNPMREPGSAIRPVAPRDAPASMITPPATASPEEPTP